MYVSITCITWVIGDIFVANMYMYNLGYRIDPLSTLRLIMAFNRTQHTRFKMFLCCVANTVSCDSVLSPTCI